MFRSNRFYPVLAITIFSLAVHQASAQQTQPQPQSTEQTQAGQATPDHRPRSVPRYCARRRERVKARRKLRDQQVIQDTYTHKYEGYFGGNYLRFRPGNNLQHINEAGWHAGVTDYMFGKIGITVDGRGYYGTAYTGRNQYGVYEPSISQYTFMGGPSVRFYEGLHWGWTAQVLAGVGHGNFGTGTGGLPPELVSLYPDGNSFNLSAGASVDYNLSPTLALRLTPGYLMTRYGSSTQNLGFTAGAVWRWGRQ